MKILTLANCQATAIEHLLKNVSVHGNTIFETVPCPPSHTWDAGFESELKKQLCDCDVLLYQPHQVYSWSPPWRTSKFWLEYTSAAYKISFPSLFFSGYSPELTYISGKNGQHLNGGFCDYHDIRIIRLFLSGVSPEKANEQMDWIYLEKDAVSDYAQRSLDELEKRENEGALNIRVSSYLREHYKKRRQFFTFNHPANELLLNVVDQLLELLCVKDFTIKTSGYELLNIDYLPIMSSVAKGLSLPFSDNQQDYVIQRKNLSRLEVIKRYFEIYTDNREIAASFYNACSRAEKFKMMTKNQFATARNLSIKERVQRKKNDEEILYHSCLGDPDFVRYKCDPQTLSFMSDISFQLRRLYPVVESEIKDVLDVGARTAIGSWFLHKLHHPGSFSAVRMKVTALDIENKYKEYANTFYPDIDYVVGDIFNLPHKSRDIVICSHTIEHVKAPRLFIEQLCKIAKEYVIIACPYEEPPGSLIPGHVHSISKKFIDQFDYELLEVYTSMHWHQSKACIFAIKTNGKKRGFMRFFKK